MANLLTKGILTNVQFYINLHAVNLILRNPCIFKYTEVSLFSYPDLVDCRDLAD